jgi:diaminopimelate decarboxylase
VKPPPLDFGHSLRKVSFWKKLAAEAARGHQTPFYLFSVEPIRKALAELKCLDRALPVRHWLSCKTQPLRPLLRWWRRQGRGIEVVSEFELLAALKEAFKPEQILVNGPAKHHWLPRHAVSRLSVNFDSLREIEVLGPLAKSLDWRAGIRFLTGEEFDPETPTRPTQFGLAPDAAVQALDQLRRAGALVEIAHFHLRTNVASAAIYERAIRELARICRAARWTPRILDCGGGFPPPHTRSREGRPFDAQFGLVAFSKVYETAVRLWPGLQEIWLENGRFLTARSGVLVTRVLDVKERRGLRQLICDAGRTNHALLSNWEAHQLLTLPSRGGPAGLTVVCGPTCMAFDQLTCRALPRTIREGDLLIWMEAGAYHQPWETRFSHGLATVLWHENGKLRVVRNRETFEDWWGQWR